MLHILSTFKYSSCQLFVYNMDDSQDSKKLVRKGSRMNKLKRFFSRKNGDSEDPHFKSSILGPEIKRLSNIESKSTNQFQDFPVVPATELKNRKANIKKFLTKRPQRNVLKDKGIYILNNKPRFCLQCNKFHFFISLLPSALAGYMKNEAVFGSTLEELQNKDDQMVPKFVLKCIQCIENEDFLKIDGIYRVAGSLAEIQSIRGQSFKYFFDGRYLYSFT